MKNKYNLPRNIPDGIKREIRQACGFGCVICGSSIYTYEHVDPLFAEAERHDPNSMTLLCYQCHGKVTSNFLSKQTVKEAMHNPFCKKTGYASEFLDIGKVHPYIIFAGSKIINTQIPILVGDLPLFQIKRAEVVGTPFRLSANFFNSKGELSLQIIDNEWYAYESNWDIEVSGGAVVIRDNPRHISLRLLVKPPNGIIIEKLDMLLGDLHFIGDNSELQIIPPSGRKSVLRNFIASNCVIGMKF